MEAFEAALLEASIEVYGGSYTPIQLEEMVNQEQVVLGLLVKIIGFIIIILKIWEERALELL